MPQLAVTIAEEKHELVVALVSEEVLLSRLDKNSRPSHLHAGVEHIHFAFVEATAQLGA
jgi:hypothetical protein